jgi:hypothetical protein
MSATTEKRRNPAKRAEVLQRELDRRQEKLGAALAEIEKLKAEQPAIVAETLRGDPGKSAYERGKPAYERERRQNELETTASHLREEITALQADLAAVSVELAERRLAEALLRMRKLADEERDVVGKGGDLLRALVKHWNVRAGLLDDRRAIAERVRAHVLVRTLGASRPDLVEAWEQAAASTLAPQALSFGDFVSALVAAALAERPDVDAERAAVDELNRRRREHARLDPGGGDDLPPIPRPMIQLDPLFGLVPDLRDEVAKFDPTVAGEPLARSAEAQIQGLAEAGFGLTEPLGYATDGGLRLPWRRPSPPEAA